MTDQTTIEGTKADQNELDRLRVDRILKTRKTKPRIWWSAADEKYMCQFPGRVQDKMVQGHNLVSRKIDHAEVLKALADEDKEAVANLFACDVGYCSSSTWYGNLKGELEPVHTIDGELSYAKACERCRDGLLSDDSSEPKATVYFGSTDGDRDDENMPHTIGDYHDDTDGVFKAVYHRTDGWRGYYEVESDTYRKMHEDCALWGSADATELKAFDDKLRKFCDDKKIRYARVFTRTSNVCSMGYDFFVHKDDLKEFEKATVAIKVAELRLEHRDPEVFQTTALTGKDPEEFDQNDKTLVEAYNQLAAGVSVDEVMGFVKAEIERQ